MLGAMNKRLGHQIWRHYRGISKTIF